MRLATVEGQEHPLAIRWISLHGKNPSVGTCCENNFSLSVELDASNFSLKIAKRLNQGSVLSVPRCKIPMGITWKEHIVIDKLKHPDEALVTLTVLDPRGRLLSLLYEMQFARHGIEAPLADGRVGVASENEAFVLTHLEAETLWLCFHELPRQFNSFVLDLEHLDGSVFTGDVKILTNEFRTPDGRISTVLELSSVALQVPLNDNSIEPSCEKPPGLSIRRVEHITPTILLTASRSQWLARFLFEPVDISDRTVLVARYD